MDSPDQEDFQNTPEGKEEGEANSQSENSDVGESTEPRRIIDSSEEEDDEEMPTEADLNFIASESEDEQQDDHTSHRRKRKEKKRRREVIEQLSDDELELINENIGKQKKKLRKKGDDGVDDVAMLFEQEKEEEDDDLDDFIIRDDEDELDDEDTRREKRLRKKEMMQQAKNLGAELGITDSQWRDLDELFGTGDDYPHALYLNDETVYEEDEDGEVAAKKKVQVSLKDVYEPSEIKEKMLTDQDELVRIRDMPERFQGTEKYVPQDSEASREANIITRLFLKDKPDISEKTFNTAITFVLRFLRREHLEVPFIWRHRKDYFDGILSQNDLWRIVDLDENFISVELKKRELGQLIVDISNVDPTIEEDPELAKLIEKIVTQDDVKDTFAYIHLLYSQQVGQLESTQQHRKMFKRASWKVLYDDAISNDIKKLAAMYDIKIPKFVGSMTTQQTLHFPEDPTVSPQEAAEAFVCSKFPSVQSVLDAARHLIAQEIAVQPELLAFIRLVFNSDGIVTVEPTEKGKAEIEQYHPYFAFKYLTEKPIHKFNDGQFLQILRAETEGLITVTIRVDEEAKLIADLQKYISNDYVNDLSKLWNSERKAIAEMAAREIIFPQAVKWIKERLGVAASEYITQKCLSAMQHKLGMQGYRTPEKERPVVLSITWGDGDRNSPGYAVLLNEYGEYKEHLKLDKLTDREHQAEINKLSEFIVDNQPDLIAVGGFKANTKLFLLPMIQEELLSKVRSHKNFKLEPRVMIVDDEVARIYMNSKRGMREFPQQVFPYLVRYCISLGRYCQDPLLEYAGLYNSEEDIKNVRLDPLQTLLPEDTVMKLINRAFMFVVGHTGVDINAAVLYPHLSHSLQFVSGLGPRKANAMISKILRSGGKLESRADLIHKNICGGVVFMNCASFLRICEEHFTSGYVEQPLDVLDDTRVHPEDYELARKMAADALDYEDAGLDDDEAPSAHVKELMEGDVDKLNLLLLDDYAVELERRIHAPKKVCLNDIKQELMHPYRDTRRRFEEPDIEELFTILTGETRSTLFEGAVVSVVVTKVQMQTLWVQLGSGLQGIVFGNNTDSPNPKDLISSFQVNQALMASVLKLNFDKLNVDLSIRKDDIAKQATYIQVDKFFDSSKQNKDIHERKNKKIVSEEKQARTIQHPYWKPLNYKKAERYLETRPRGEVVVRPSAKGNDHISITWKVDEGIFQHIDIQESHKPNEWSLGKKLTIGGITFSEIDQVIAEYIEPMTRKINALLEHPKYQKKSLYEMYDYVEEQVKILKKSAYGLIIYSDRPGSFLLVYRHPTNNNPRKELVTVTPTKYEFREKKFDTIDQLLNYFKTNEAAKVRNQPPQSRDSRGRDPRNNDPRHMGGSNYRSSNSVSYPSYDRRGY